MIRLLIRTSMPIARYHLCAGGVLYDPLTKKVALIRFPNDNHHALPKGHLNEGETPEAAALREVAEETGCTNIKIVAELGVLEFQYNHRTPPHALHQKTVHHYLMELLGPEQDHTLRDADEHHEIAWLSFPDAIEKIQYDNARELLVKAQEMVASTDH